MKRLFWLGVGVAVGALVVRAVSRRAQSFTPRGIAAGLGDSAGNLFDSVRGFVEDVREGMHEREEQIHAAFAEGVTFDDEEFDSTDFDRTDFDRTDFDRTGLDRTGLDVEPDDFYLREGKRH